jgi:ABC-type multidrug transport system ATPase subunit
MILIVLVFLFPRLSFAYEQNKQDIGQEPSRVVEESSVFGKTYNVVYRFVNNHEYLFAPLSGFVAGMIRCGSKCGAVGGMAGVIDEFLINFDHTDKHYLTWGIFGITTGHLIKPSLASDIAGVTVGVLMPTGILNEHQEVIAPLVSAVAGNSIAGTPGLIGGGIAGGFDELLLNKNVYSQHYLTFGAVGMATTNLLGYFNPVVGNSIGMLLGLIASSYEKEITGNILAPVKAASDLYGTYNKFIPTEQLDSHIEEHTLALVGSQFFTQFLSLKILGYQQALTYNFERLDSPGNAVWGNFQKEITNFAIFLFPYAIGQTVSGSIDDYFDKKLRFVLEDKIRTELFSGEIPLQLSQDPNATVLMDNLKSDISTVVGSGSSLITGAVSTAINGAYGVGIIIVNSPNIFVYSALYNKAHTFIAEYLAEQRRHYGEKIIALDSKLISTMKHDTENIRTITERDGVEATRDKIGEITTNARELEGAQRLWSIATSTWWSILGTADYIFNYYLVANEIKQGRIPFVNRNKVQTAGWQVSNLLSWSGRTAQDMSYVRQSLDRIVVLEGKIYRNTTGVDQINRVAEEGNYLELRDLDIGVENRLLVRIEDLKLEMGKVYGITGESGCGKTSLLSKIKGIKENNIYGKGSIYYPKINGKDPKIVMLSQQDYFPLDASLYEILVYPDKVSKDKILNKVKREGAQTLLKEIGIYGFSDVVEPDIKDDEGKKDGEVKAKFLNLDSKENWYTYLSGGEKKKITIVSAILKKPDILILDEIFNGLDQKSTMAVQQMLKKHLPNSLILVVDHHAQDNNYGFYDKELRFMDKQVVMQDMAVRN